jgi:hypothetical protein
MPTNEIAPGEIKITVSDWQGMQDFFKEFREVRRSHLENAKSILENCFKVNQAGASFYEKLILLDGGTIALSLSLLGAHAPGSHISKAALYWFVCPAWVLLLLSIYCCWHRITQFHNTNKTLVQQFVALSSAYYLHYLGTLTTRFSRLAQGEIRIETEKHDFSAFMSDLATGLRKTGDEENTRFAALVKEASENDGKSRAARLAILATQLAFILLCVFAVKIVSSM